MRAKLNRSQDHRRMIWETVQLAEFVTLKRGYDLPSSRRVGGSVPVVSSSGITGRHNTAKVKGPGVVTGRYGTLGKVFFISDDFWPLNTSLYVQDFKGNDPRFSAYFLKHVLAKTNSDKAAVPGVNRNDLHALAVHVTQDINEQKAIVSVLSAYDDLIENNRRRIQLLERTARLLYREWFVHLRFPGHEHTRVVNDHPEGWKALPLSEICTDVRESVDPKTVHSDTAYIGLEHIPRRSITLHDWRNTVGVESKKFKFSGGDILFGRIRPYFHKIGFALVDGITSSDTIVIRPRGNSLYCFLLFLLSSDEFVALASKTMREGSKMPRADWRHLLGLEFRIPPPAILDMFNAIVTPTCSQLRSLALHNRQLTQARDLFLPRLMNGELTV